jgi:small subunit ribosomal protein S4
MGFARSRNEARQVVRHNHVLVNGKRLNIPSAHVKVGDVVSIKSASLQSPIFASAQELFARRTQLAWVQVDGAKFTGKVVSEPKREDIQLPVTDRMIVEFYSK